jgi:uncharacterized membrane protein
MSIVPEKQAGWAGRIDLYIAIAWLGVGLWKTVGGFLEKM